MQQTTIQHHLKTNDDCQHKNKYMQEFEFQHA